MKFPLYLAFLAVIATPALAADDAAVIATVNGEKITKADLQEQLAAMPPQIQQLPLTTIYPQLLEQMVVERVIRKAGYDADIDATPEAKKRVKEVEKKIVADEYLRREVKKKITTDMLMVKYNEYVKGFKAEDQVRASHILVKTEKEANEILAQLKGGADFTKLASEKSLDKAAASQGGDLGYFGKNQMVPEFEKAAFAMKVGDVSAKPVKTDFGYHIIKLVDKKKSSPESFDTLKPQLETTVSQEAAKLVVKDLMQKSVVERFDLEGKPLPKNAEIKN